jgi:holo-[acyl-carrier protein] synthase
VIGLDVVGVERFGRVLSRTPSMLDRLFTQAERVTGTGAARRVESLAARFAAKEAVAKALGAPPGWRWHDCEVVSGPDGRPGLVLRGALATAASARGIAGWHVSLTHDAGVAAAVVLAQGVDHSVAPL